MREDREAHPHVADAIHRRQRIRRTGRNTREILTQQAWRLIGEQNRSAIPWIRQDGAGWTGLDAIAAFRATLQKERFVDGARWPEPIGPCRQWHLWGYGVLVLGKLLSRFGH